MSEETTLTSGASLIFVMLFIYMTMGSLIEKYKCVIGHEASFIIIIGMTVSLGFWYFEKGHYTDMMTFDADFFFYFCLPPIVFASGYNMKRKKFFENIMNVILFGIIGTVI
jgi:sodium/hydrogen exchanger-like protein 6/7